MTIPADLLACGDCTTEGCQCAKSRSSGSPPRSCSCTPKPASPAAGEPLGIDAKLRIFDRHARQAVAELIEWLQQHPNDLIAVARGRHVTGHYRFRDRGLFEHDLDGLRGETAEEIADAIVYTARHIHLRTE